jgi:hypothetical protein
VIRSPLNGLTPDVYDPMTATVYLDPEVIRQWEEAVPGSGTWVEAHAIGHHYTLRLSLNYGPGLPGQETGADCYAQVMLNRPPPAHWPTTGGYGPCTPENQERMRTALTAAHLPLPPETHPHPPSEPHTHPAS